MATVERRSPATHEVFNQASPLEDYNPFDADRPLAGGAAPRGRRLGRGPGPRARRDLRLRARRSAGASRPTRTSRELKTHDRFGNRIDEVEFDSSWHELMRIGIEPRPARRCPGASRALGAHVARAAMFMLLMQAEAGVGCPISMTYSAIPALRKQPELRRRVGAALPLARLRRALAAGRATSAGALCGMAMTEKQGGSDVRANTTAATPLNGGGPGAEYEITGHKWFCSAPMCDAFLVLAQTDSGVSCFLMPRWTPDGERNAFHIQRLKDKLGNRSNASSEVEFRGAWARMVGEEGRGVPTIIEMVNHTRLDCVIGAASRLSRRRRAGAPPHRTPLCLRQAT